MNARRQGSEHQEVVSRRLALLSAELAAGRPAPVDDGAATERDGATERDDPDQRDHADQLDAVVLRPGPPTWREDRPPREPASQVEPAPRVPVPGRHASRRVGAAMADALPEALRGRVLLGPGPVAVVAVLVALGLATTCWWVVRSDSAEVVAPVAPAPAGSLVSAPATSPSAPVGAPRRVGATAGAAAAGAPVTVDVAGKVHRPGIAVLDAGARVVDALEAAGGARRGVDLSSLNLARPLVDGEQILVGVPTPPGLVASAAPAAGATAGPLVNLNTASQTELETLPDVGPVTAEAIIAWRTEHGGYTAVEELLEVDGIGDATLTKLAPHVTV